MYTLATHVCTQCLVSDGRLRRNVKQNSRPCQHESMESSPCIIQCNSVSPAHDCVSCKSSSLKSTQKDAPSSSQSTSLLGVHLHLITTNLLNRLVCRTPSVELSRRARLLFVHFLRYRDRVVSTESLAHVDHAAPVFTRNFSSVTLLCWEFSERYPLVRRQEMIHSLALAETFAQLLTLHGQLFRQRRR